jgi:hypothetical protein
MTGPFSIPFEKLPPSLPIFPLPNAVVMPGCQLPLNIFEPRYLNMVFDALASGRLIGMIQPDPAADGRDPKGVCRTGTAGRISFFNETGDGRLMIVLSGICRFDVTDEIATTRGYRRALVDWRRFACDYEEATGAEGKDTVVALMSDYFSRKGLQIDQKAVAAMDTQQLVNWLTGVLPLEVAERQALIEAVSLDERTQILTTLLHCETLDRTANSSRRH